MSVRKPQFSPQLLTRLAQKSESGNTISVGEAKKEVKTAVAELKSKYLDRGNTSGLKKDMEAVRNTFEKAIDSGWVKGKTAKAVIETFINDDFSTAVDDIRSDVRAENPVSRNYGYSRSSYTPPRTRYTGT